MPRTDKALLIADALETSVEWLFRGSRPGLVHLVDVTDADWIEVPRFDLRQLTDEGHGDQIDATLFRRDWLNRTLRETRGIWMAEMLSDYGAAGLAEADVIFCKDMAREELAEGFLCLFREEAGLFVGKFSFRSHSGLSTDDTIDDVIVTASELDPHIHLVARIMGRLIERF